MIRAGLVTILTAAALTASPALAAHTSACSTKSLRSTGTKVVKVDASGVSCAKAIAVARKVASQVAKNGSVDIPDVTGFELATETCTGCGGTTTQVILSYRSGAKLTISIRGGKVGQIQNPTPIPQPLPTPSQPTPGTAGSGPITV